MFDNLVESKPVKERSTGQTLGSALIHLVLIAVAVRVTASAAETVQAINRDTTLMFIRPPDPPPPAPEQAPSASGTRAERGFQLVIPPLAVPMELPAMNLSVPFDPRNYTGVGQVGGTWNGAPDGAGTVGTDLPSLGTQVDVVARYLGGPDPKYPPALRAANIEGRVVLRFVVGIDGKVEPNSVAVVSSTNSAFDEPATEAIKEGKFEPAELGGKKVRQLVEQAVMFRIR